LLSVEHRCNTGLFRIGKHLSSWSIAYFYIVKVVEFIDPQHYAKGYVLKNPDPLLNRYVDFIHLQQLNCLYPGAFIDETCFASFGFNLLFPVRGHCTVLINNKRYAIRSAAFVPRHSVIKTLQGSNDVMLGFKCKLNLFRERTMVELMRNQAPVDLRDLLPVELVTRLEKIDPVEEKIKAVETVLLDVMDGSKAQRTSSHVDEALQMVASYFNRGLTIRQLSKELFVSQKSLTRYFLQHTGITPKEVFTTMRFRKALRLYLADPECFDLSHFGYFDHSHFYKEVKAYTGWYPRQLFNMAVQQHCPDAVAIGARTI